MTNAILILASVLVITFGAFALVRAYRQHTTPIMFVGAGLIALGFGFSSLRVNNRTAAAVFIAISIAVNLVGIYWRNAHPQEIQ